MRYSQAIYGWQEYAYARLFGLHADAAGRPPGQEMQENAPVKPTDTPTEEAASSMAKMAAKVEEAPTRTRGGQSKDLRDEIKEEEEEEESGTGEQPRGEETALAEAKGEEFEDWEMPSYTPTKKKLIRGNPMAVAVAVAMCFH